MKVGRGDRDQRELGELRRGTTRLKVFGRGDTLSDRRLGGRLLGDNGDELVTEALGKVLFGLELREDVLERLEKELEGVLGGERGGAQRAREEIAVEAQKGIRVFLLEERLELQDLPWILECHQQSVTEFVADISLCHGDFARYNSRRSCPKSHLAVMEE